MNPSMAQMTCAQAVVPESVAKLIARDNEIPATPLFVKGALSVSTT